MNRITDAINSLLVSHDHIIAAIDGRCASGKTTLAAGLQKEFFCNVFHMDDFFLRPEQRTCERLEQPGGNVDYERFLKEVLLPLKSGRSFSYQPYCCKTGQMAEPVQVSACEVNIVEGSYSCHPALWEHYDLHIFLDISPQEQMRRIVLRNGEEAAQRFKTLWIPLEEKYFKEFDIASACEIRL